VAGELLVRPSFAEIFPPRLILMDMDRHSERHDAVVMSRAASSDETDHESVKPDFVVPWARQC
jgi:hypothetical protein